MFDALSKGFRNARNRLSGVTELSGRMVYELKGNDCKGYEQRTRFVDENTYEWSGTNIQGGREPLPDLKITFSRK